MDDLMNRSMINLQDTFTSTWGVLYSRNSQLFHDLYQDLRDYYRRASVNLEEVLNEFWTRLLEKLFYQANKQSSLGEDYQECVSKKIETLRLFGEAPHKVTTQVTRTFVAARAFLQGLNTSREVVGKVLQAEGVESLAAWPGMPLSATVRRSKVTGTCPAALVALILRCGPHAPVWLGHQRRSTNANLIP
ncbi:hypothetical protein AMECASPLE_008712 [Ameca splendens]|uniref:Glypican-1 n=1 Tax=Ameca splendens TaxID=208324 RepID=A0ABV0ZLU1_9TELE